MNIAILVFSYILGSIPFGYIITKIYQNTDIRAHGSGNIGATNVLRVLGLKAALPVFILDTGKGFSAIMIARLLSDLPVVYLSAGLLVLLGHCFPLFLKFKGGKAAATSIGVLLALSWWITLIVVAIAFIVILVTKYVSLGSIIGVMSAPILFWIFNYSLEYIIFGIAMAILVIGRHHGNIGRLISGNESKLGQKGKNK